MPEKEKQIEEIDDDASDSDSDMPDLEHAEDGEGGDEGTTNRPKQSRAEKKARKALLKLGMKPLPAVQRVTIRRAKNIIFVLSKPDVYRFGSSDTYIVFGDAKIEDSCQPANSNIAHNLANIQLDPQLGKGNFQPGQKKIEEIIEGDVDETGLEPKDIDLVISQVNCSRAKAVAALRQHKGDIVEAIMQLSS
eukprot:GHVR01177182.1.p1 GENE.GHVR01177182.1~~GHVR01177182.1.p1  ORF type:complete len:192 (-),score=46.99 GHVR01177182.1:247-822(-)